MLPGFRNLAGTVRSEKRRLRVGLRSHVASLTFPGVFQQERMNFDEAHRRRGDPHEARPDGRDPRSLRREPRRRRDGARELEGDGRPWRSGPLREDPPRRGRLGTEIPPRVIGAGVLNYLRGAILGATRRAARWKLKGELTRFPSRRTNLGKRAPSSSKRT